MAIAEKATEAFGPDAQLDYPAKGQQILLVNVLSTDTVETGMQLPINISETYLADTVLGEGATAWVLHAIATKEHPSVEKDRHIALKLYKTEPTGALAKQRIAREIALSKHLSHPNLLRVHDSGFYQLGPFSVPYLVMELLDGETLASLIEDSYHDRYSEVEVLLWLQQVTSALQYLHEANLLHRDIHPGNIMISSDTRATLMDYGLVFDVTQEPLTPQWDFVGARRHLAPECIWDLGHPRTQASDLYSLGSTFYQLSTGHLVHHHKKTYADYFRALLQEEPVLANVHNSTISPWLALILDCLISVEPTHRIQPASLLFRIVTALLKCRFITLENHDFGWTERNFPWVPLVQYERKTGVWQWTEHGRASGPTHSLSTLNECIAFLQDGYGDNCIAIELPDRSFTIVWKDVQVARLHRIAGPSPRSGYGPWFVTVADGDYLVTQVVPAIGYEDTILYQIESALGMKPIQEDDRSKTTVFVHFETAASGAASLQGAKCLRYQDFLAADSRLAEKTLRIGE